jgi:hypothetical protein
VADEFIRNRIGRRARAEDGSGAITTARLHGVSPAPARGHRIPNDFRTDSRPGPSRSLTGSHVRAQRILLRGLRIPGGATSPGARLTRSRGRTPDASQQVALAPAFRDVAGQIRSTNCVH